MPTFKFECEHRTPWDSTLESRNTTECEYVYLEDVIMAFQDFLRGSGFYFEGNLTIVEKETVTKEEKCGGDCSSCGCGSNSEPTSSVNRVETIHVSSSKCPVCGLTNEQLGFHACYDQKCPKVPKTYTMAGQQ